MLATQESQTRSQHVTRHSYGTRLSDGIPALCMLLASAPLALQPRHPSSELMPHADHVQPHPTTPACPGLCTRTAGTHSRHPQLPIARGRGGGHACVRAVSRAHTTPWTLLAALLRRLRLHAPSSHAPRPSSHTPHALRLTRPTPHSAHASLGPRRLQQRWRRAASRSRTPLRCAPAASRARR